MSEPFPMPAGYLRCRVCKDILRRGAFYPSSLRAKVYVCRECDREVRAARRRTGRYRERDTARYRAWRAKRREEKLAGRTVDVTVDEYCPLCDRWLPVPGFKQHEDRHMQERAA